MGDVATHPACMVFSDRRLASIEAALWALPWGERSINTGAEAWARG